MENANPDQHEDADSVSPSTVPTKLQNQLVQRSPNGQLLPGSQLGKLARQKGTKNRITQQKLGIEAVLRDTLNEHMPEIILKAIEMAKKGDRKMISELLRLTISPAQSVEDISEGKEKVQVTIRRLNIDTINSGPREPLRLDNVIDGEFDVSAPETGLGDEQTPVFESNEDLRIDG